jgi:hypothetical protein
MGAKSARRTGSERNQAADTFFLSSEATDTIQTHQMASGRFLIFAVSMQFLSNAGAKTSMKKYLRVYGDGVAGRDRQVSPCCHDAEKNG